MKFNTKFVPRVFFLPNFLSAAHKLLKNSAIVAQQQCSGHKRAHARRMLVNFATSELAPLPLCIVLFHRHTPQMSPPLLIFYEFFLNFSANFRKSLYEFEIFHYDFAGPPALDPFAPCSEWKNHPVSRFREIVQIVRPAVDFLSSENPKRRRKMFYWTRKCEMPSEKRKMGKFVLCERKYWGVVGWKDAPGEQKGLGRAEWTWKWRNLR